MLSNHNKKHEKEPTIIYSKSTKVDHLLPIADIQFNLGSSLFNLASQVAITEHHRHQLNGLLT